MGGLSLFCRICSRKLLPSAAADTSLEEGGWSVYPKDSLFEGAVSVS